MALGTRGLLEDQGVQVGITMYSDASAALGIALRRGVGKARHIEVRQLWLQDRVAHGDIEVVKVKGEENPADALTNHSDSSKLEAHCRAMGHRRGVGRSLSAHTLMT